MATWIAAASAYSVHNCPLIPFYVFYSMFGFQRVGDLAWAAGDMRCRGFLVGGTSGRTTLNGEGLQHEDGQSHLLASAIPNCRSFDPTFAYEVAVIVQDGLRRMCAEQEDVYYYLTTLNENYAHPGMPEGAQPGHPPGHVPVQGRGGGGSEDAAGAAARLRRHLPRGDRRRGHAAQPLGRGERSLQLPQLHRARARRDGRHPGEPAQPGFSPRRPYVEACLAESLGPVVAATDYVRAYAEQIRPYLPRRYFVLGTDGFGRSDTREKLRRFFEVNRHHVTVAALYTLSQEGTLPKEKVAEAIARYGLDRSKPAPWTV